MHYLLRGLAYAIGFAIIEASFRSVTLSIERRKLSFEGSTWAMFVVSIVTGLYIIEPGYWVMTYFGAPFYLRLLLWPFVIWGVEILSGAWLFYACNQTRAWFYEGRFAYFNGFIELSYYGYWVAMGAGIEYFWYLIGFGGGAF